MATKAIPQNTLGDDKQRLFIKEGDDIFIQKSSSNSGASSSHTNGIRTSVYKHFESNMRVVVCRVPSPIYTLNIYVPTAVTDNKGLPHTLEHLIFCGSKRYPTRGYVDVLAAHNFSVGTNAWTSSDHTCYTLDAASEDAMANVLPAFLDHILSPLLRDDQFVTEVYHYDVAGKEQGVVFSEMVSYENNENELATYHLGKLMYNPKATYANYSGGKTRDIANLTNKEIIDYHHKYYDANNITVVLTGAFTDEFEEKYVQTIPADIVQSHGCDSREPMDCSPPRSGIVRHETQKFPSTDMDSGSIIFGWHGPQHEDTESSIALEILIEYLAGTPSSPLNLRFVERASPLASSIDASVNDTITKTLELSFTGVPYAHNESLGDAEDSSDDEGHDETHDGDDEDDAEDPDISHLFEECYLEDLLTAEFKRIIETRFDGDSHALEHAAKRLIDGLALTIEKNPGHRLQDLFYSDIVASHFSSSSHGKFHIGSRAKQFDMIAELGSKPIEFWLDLLKKWFIDGTAYYVAMIPDPELGPKLEAERKQIEKANEAKIVDKEAHVKYIKESIASNKANVPDEMKRAMPTPDPTKAGIIPHTQGLIVLDKGIGPVAAVQTISVDSGFVETQIQIPIGDIPGDLRAYLVLFQELLLGTDMVLPAGVIYDDEKDPLKAEKRISYADFESRLSDLVTSRFVCVGQNSDQFTCSWLDDLFVVGFLAPYTNYSIALRWVVQGLIFADFTTDRILASSQNLLTSIAELKREAGDVMYTVGMHFMDTSLAGKPLSNRRHMGFLGQEGVLKSILEKTKAGKVDEVVEKLRKIQNTLIRATGGFMALSLPSSEASMAYLDALACEWNMCFKKHTAGRSNQPADSAANIAAVKKKPFPIAYESRFPALTKPLLVHVPVQSLQASVSLFSFKLDLPDRPTGKRSFDDELNELISIDHFALSMLTALLGRIDGPLDNAVRGNGYSYGAFIYIAQWSRKLVLEIDRASDIVKAVAAIKQVITDMQDNWDSYVSDTDVSLARSVVQYQNTVAQSTPTRMLEKSIANSINGFSDAKEYNTWCNVHTAAVTKSDMRRVCEKYLSRFVDDKYPLFGLLVTPSDTDVPAELGPFERKTLEELSATYKTDY
ncbi:hypothetical protein IW140_001217 [Coemansia sp. RSA 1813]|nr:hypothetical protein EV178_001193 [Coemansia sp. RSA 1646]KAJ1772151.1 hypothetical protein LPJ74_001736 [Coemansia sp. RSA 1843]KAJ2091730.1 hypothetical protein IW138_001713 [Coemansia sp. RSA 986]KAJ2216866.1 hypothetical protein EV179_000900 [Coemansia sp. RSA 487]KAJ2571868.1 hypothetical protein IW140_001217 [Coemansia sp. RSA 1813]